MAELIRRLTPADVWEALSAYELALLLLAAYLHDVGMTPAQRMVAAHHGLLIEGSADHLSARDISEFQEWLDHVHPGVEIEDAPGAVGVEQLREIDWLVAGYVRHRHIDWGEQWARANIDLDFPGYPQVKDDLLALCRSHGEGFDVLASEAFAPRFLNGGDDVVHRRYLASLLRVSDVLDIDPERTPRIIFQHRDISPDSVVYWYKDHELSLAIEASGRVIAEAAPRSAVVHRAIVDTLDQIEAELRLVQALDALCPFAAAPPRTDPLPHRWNIDPVIQRQVSPKGNAYEFVNGAFRPDTAKVLDLLGAVQLYGDELVAVRELLQNAFDAVRERMAWQKLKYQGADDDLLSVLLKRHEVRITFEKRDDGRYWLECADSGAGMTKRILTDHFLVSGRGPAPDILELQRAARKEGISFTRTGKFGIGVLSYFMLADRVALSTFRCDEAPTVDGSSWNFVTDGVGSFGELRAGRPADVGSRVGLRVRESVLKRGADSFWNDLARYLRSELDVLPCDVRLVGPDVTSDDVRVAGGWVPPSMIYRRINREHDRVRREKPQHLLGPSARRSHNVELAERAAAREAADAVVWSEITGELPFGLGAFRCAVPTFDLAGGLCLGYMRPVEAGSSDLVLFNDRPMVIPTFGVSMSWHGIRVQNCEHGMGQFRFPWIDFAIDWRADAAGQLDVSRKKLVLSDEAERALEHVVTRAAELVESLLGRHADSEFRAINMRLANTLFKAVGKPLQFDVGRWYSFSLGPAGLAGGRWGDVEFPAVEVMADEWPKAAQMGIDGVSVNCIDPLEDHNRWMVSVPWSSPTWDADRVVIHPSERALVRVWDSRPDGVDMGPFGSRATFPSEFAMVGGALYEDLFVLNRDHPLSRVLTAESREWASGIDWNVDPVAYASEICASPAHAASWFVALVVHESWDPEFAGSELWESLLERESEIAERIWWLIRDIAVPVVGGRSALCFFSRGYDSMSVVQIEESGWSDLEMGSAGLGYDWLRIWSSVPDDFRMAPLSRVERG